MLLFQTLEKSFSLIDLEFYYFRVKEYMLDISSPSITNDVWLLPRLTVVGSTVVKNCSLYQIKASNE